MAWTPEMIEYLRRYGTGAYGGDPNYRNYDTGTFSGQQNADRKAAALGYLTWDPKYDAWRDTREGKEGQLWLYDEDSDSFSKWGGYEFGPADPDPVVDPGDGPVTGGGAVVTGPGAGSGGGGGAGGGTGGGVGGGGVGRNPVTMPTIPWEPPQRVSPVGAGTTPQNPLGNNGLGAPRGQRIAGRGAAFAPFGDTLGYYSDMLRYGGVPASTGIDG